MASTDWTFCGSGLASNQVDRGVTNGITRPNGGDNFLYGFNSLVVTAGAVALFANQANFAPMAAGGSVRAAIKRGVSGGPTGFSPFIFIGLQGTDIADSAYMLGLSDDDPHRISLVKGAISGGIPSALPGQQGVLARSTATFANDTWLHLRLDMIVNLNGDVILQAFQNDLNAHLVSSPTWVAIAGTAAAAGQTLANFVDDSVQVNSGSAPFVSGRGGFGFRSGDVTRRAFFDQIEVSRQV